MSHAVVVAENPSWITVIFSSLPTSEWECISWGRFTPDKLSRSRSDLLVLVGLPDPAPVLELLRAKENHSLPAKVIAVLPRELERDALNRILHLADEFISGRTERRSCNFALNVFSHPASRSIVPTRSYV